MKKQKKRNIDEVNYWESMADSMVALLLWVLLIALLLIIYLVRIPEDVYVDLEQGNSYEKYDDADDGGGNHAYGQIDDEPGETWGGIDTDYDDNGADYGGVDGGDGDGLQDNQYEDPDPGAGEGQGKDKSAVLVQVVDGETGRTIKKKGMEFELYGSNSALQVLSTYYPKKVDYKKFATDETGVFYLPERISLSGYYLHCLSVLNGYDTAQNTEFNIDRSSDWEDPYVVTVAFYPSKNIARIQLKDQDNGKKLTGASFQIVAAENIVTQDGTTRCKEGDVVDTVTVDENGYAESKELFLGNYLIRQKDVPEYYSLLTEDTKILIQGKKNVGTPEVTEILEKKTSIRITVTDALYDTMYIADAKFKLTEGDAASGKDLVTDASGTILVSDLKKNRTYHLKQIAAAGDYKINPAEYSFTVNGDGLIDGKGEADVEIKNRMIRTVIGVRDRIFRGQVSDVNVAVYDAGGTVIKVWNTSALEQTMEGLLPGEYRVVLNGNQQQGHTILVEDTAELQIYQFDQWTTADLGAIAGLGVLILAGIGLLIVFMKRRQNTDTRSK